MADKENKAGCSSSGSSSKSKSTSKSPKKQVSEAMDISEDDDDDSSGSSVELTIDEAAGPSSKRRRRRIKTKEATKLMLSEGLEEFEEEIEQQLGSKAKKTKLTVANVKNILKHVITNQHVLAMVKQSMRGEGDDGVSSDDDDDNCPYEPKLTRAKTKELLLTQTPMPWPVTPVKTAPGSATKKLIDQVHDDSSDDEEYQPNEDETENSDDECNSSLASDADQALTLTPSTPRSIADCSTQTTWTEDGVFKMPNTNFELMEAMGMRTRSKVSLTGITLEAIEQSFVPPDITTDMYETECDNEDWKQFLNEFVQPLKKFSEVQDDDEADPEYNILEDEEKEDKEEMRADRAVKVSKKELNELISELMEFMEPSDDEADADVSFANTIYQMDETISAVAATPPSTPATKISETLTSPMVVQIVEQSPQQVVQFLRPATPAAKTPQPLVLIKTPPEDTDEDSPDEEGQHVLVQEDNCEPFLSDPIFLSGQRMLLKQQLTQHVQLLAQSYMQSTIFPEYHLCSQEIKEDLISLKYLGGLKPDSAFYAQNLKSALETIENWDVAISSETGRKDLSTFYEEEKKREAICKRKKSSNIPHLNGLFLKAVSLSQAFMYPTLLPFCGFLPFRGHVRNNTFVSSEDSLVAVGLEQFMEFMEQNQILGGGVHGKKVTVKNACIMLADLLLPIKTASAIENRIKLVKGTLPDNPITCYFVNGECPGVVHRVYPIKLMSPAQQHPEFLPIVWRAFIHGDVSQVAIK